MESAEGAIFWHEASNARPVPYRELIASGKTMAETPATAGKLQAEY